MSLETGTFVQDLVPANPLGSDAILQGDDHIRLIKSVLDTTFPNADRGVYFPRALAKTGAYSVVSADMHKFITGDATGGAFSLTLPTLTSGQDGWYAVFQKIDSSANAVTLAGTINGVSGLVLTAQFNSAIVYWTGTAWYALSFGGGGTVRTITSNATLTLADVGTTILCNPTGSNMTLGLPAAAGWAGRSITFKQITASFATTLDGNSSETIDGATTQVLRFNNETIVLTSDGTNVRITSPTLPIESFTVACSDEDTPISTGTKIKFRAAYAMALIAVKGSLSTAQASGSTFTVDVKESGSTIFSTKLTIDNTETTTASAAAPPVLSDTAIADDAEISISVDQIGDSTAKGLKLTFIYRRVLS